MVISPANLPVCHADSIKLIASDGTYYLWSDSSSLSSITVNPNVITTYSITVTANNSVQCGITYSVVLYPSSDSAIVISQDKTIMCVGDTVHICAPQGAAIYNWNNSDSTACIAPTLAET